LKGQSTEEGSSGRGSHLYLALLDLAGHDGLERNVLVVEADGGPDELVVDLAAQLEHCVCNTRTTRYPQKPVRSSALRWQGLPFFYRIRTYTPSSTRTNQRNKGNQKLEAAIE